MSRSIYSCYLVVVVVAFSSMGEVFLSAMPTVLSSKLKIGNYARESLEGRVEGNIFFDHDFAELAIIPCEPFPGSISFSLLAFVLEDNTTLIYQTFSPRLKPLRADLRQSSSHQTRSNRCKETNATSRYDKSFLLEFTLVACRIRLQQKIVHQHHYEHGALSTVDEE